MDGYDRDTGEVLPMGATHRWSQPCNELFAALAKAQSEIKNAAKDSTNPHFRSKYADLTSVREACMPQLTKYGLGVVQMPVNAGQSGIGVVTLMTHSSGQWIESTIYVQPTKFDAQGAGSAITYLRRYALAAMAGVAPEDDDGEAAVAGGVAPRQAAPPTTLQPTQPRRAPPPRQQAQDYTPAQQAIVEETRRLREQIAAGNNPVGTVEWRSWLTNSIDAFGEEQTMRVEADLKERASRLNAAYGTAG